jgi:hypothetical protein
MDFKKSIDIANLALLHEAAHAWVILRYANMPVTIVLPSSPLSKEDPRCEWDSEEWFNRTQGVATVVTIALSGLAAELNAGVPEYIAWESAKEDILSLTRCGLPRQDIPPFLMEVRGILNADSFFKFLEWLRGEITQDGLHISLTPDILQKSHLKR